VKIVVTDSGLGGLSVDAESVQEASGQIDSDAKKIYAGFCCTHYEYSGQMFFDKYFTNSTTTIKVISQVKFRNSEIDSLMSIFREKSPKTATALAN